MKKPTSSAALLSLLSTTTAAGNAAGNAAGPRCRSLPALAFTATAPSCSLSEGCGSSGRRHSSSTSSGGGGGGGSRHAPFARLRPAVGRGWSRTGSGGSRTRLPGHNPAVSRAASAAAGSGPKMAAEAPMPWTTGCTAGGGEQERGWFARAAEFGRAGLSAGRPGMAAAAGGAGESSSAAFGGPEGEELEEDRCIRRLDTAVSRARHLRRLFSSPGVFWRKGAEC